MSRAGTLAVTEPGSRVSYRAEQIVVSRGREDARRVRVSALARILLYGPSEISSGAIAACLKAGIDVVFLTTTGRYRGRITGPQSRNSPLRLAQYRLSLDRSRSLAIAQTFVEGKIRNQRTVVLRAQRRVRSDTVAGAAAAMRLLLPAVRKAESHESLRGFEGQASALYFGVFGRLIANAHFSFDKRTRRPPRDPVNACLSFGYAVLTSEVESAVCAAGLDPLIGFLHEPAYGRPSLALDLVEEFRAAIVDRLVLRLLNRRQLSPADFGEPEAREDLDVDEDEGEGEVDGDEAEEEVLEAVHLSRTGRRVLLSSYHRLMRDKVFYRPGQCRVDHREVILRQAYALARVIEGREEEYAPFVPR